MQEKNILVENPQDKNTAAVQPFIAETNTTQQNRGALVHGEDVASKFAMQFFGAELLPYLGIHVKVTQIMPTELVHLELKHIYEDFNFQTEEGLWYHMEFESDSISTDDLRRFRTYEAITSQTYKVPVITCVLCSSDVKRPMNSLKEGINTYRVRVIRLKGQNADTIFSNLKEKAGNEVTKADLVPVVFTPLMGGKLTPAERTRLGIRILSEEYEKVSKQDLNRMQAALFVLADKFLTRTEMEKVKEVCAVNAFLQMYVDDGVQKATDAILSLVARMQKDEEDASKIQLLETDLELRKKMMEKYQITL